MSRTIAILTDFGIRDIYVGVMKGVMLNICNSARFIDITHAIQPQNVRQAAFALMNAYRYFAPGTIFLVVVDPGVGGRRRPVAVQAGDYFFVAPDNGVLAYVLSELNPGKIVNLTNPAHQLSEVSHTFHGRDIFAPAAAHIANGTPLEALGEVVDTLVDFMVPELEIGHKTITGEVVHIDNFGNVVTSIGVVQWLDHEMAELNPRFGRVDHTRQFHVRDVRVNINKWAADGLKRTYSEAEIGELLLTVDSNGYIEMAICQGNCASRLGTTIGDRVRMTIGG
ncbi:MAG: SAM-dependent chlorinase/fluorinase [Anaerolineae bacterium]|nr:SAM-dependent chlorinase/fluorinase [Anaerolineae bacterium]